MRIAIYNNWNRVWTRYGTWEAKWEIGPQLMGKYVRIVLG